MNAVGSNIKVALRVKPTLKQCDGTIQKASNKTLKCSTTQEVFHVDHVFGPDDSQEIVYNTSVSNLVDKFLEGYNATVMAYGQTGSGKTYSIGLTDCSTIKLSTGIIPRVVYKIFDSLATLKFKTVVKISFLEIYNDHLYDLFNYKKGLHPISLEVRRNNKLGMSAHGAKEIAVFSFSETMKLIQDGIQHRKTAFTALNESSSRSHAVFTLYLHQTKAFSNSVESMLISKFHLIDLAGSENQKKANNIGLRMKEGININLELHVLGKVISALTNQRANVHSYIPYRESRLTYLLQDSLGGNSYTVLIACVSQYENNLKDTLNTLRFAQKCQYVVNKPSNLLLGLEQKVDLNKKIEDLQQMVNLLSTENSSKVEREDYEELKSINSQICNLISKLVSFPSCLENSCHYNGDEEDYITSDSIPKCIDCQNLYNFGALIGSLEGRIAVAKEEKDYLMKNAEEFKSGDLAVLKVMKYQILINDVQKLRIKFRNSREHILRTIKELEGCSYSDLTQTLENLLEECNEQEEELRTILTNKKLDSGIFQVNFTSNADSMYFPMSQLMESLSNHNHKSPSAKLTNSGDKFKLDWKEIVDEIAEINANISEISFKGAQKFSG